MIFIDSHTHIDGEEYDRDRDEVIQRAGESGVRAMLTVGTGDPHSGKLERAVELAERHEVVYAAIGVHPHDARLFDEEAAKRLCDLARQSRRVVAWGEIGLDYHYDHSPPDVQRRVFAEQLRLADRLKLPVIIHSREAEDDTVRILQAEWSDAQRGGVMHCFSGNLRTAEEMMKIGLMISFAGNLTFKKAEELRNVAGRIPLDHVLIETDCPFLAPVPFRGRRNEPAYVVEVARTLAELHHTTVEEVGRITAANFERLFRVELGAAPADPGHPVNSRTS